MHLPKVMESHSKSSLVGRRVRVRRGFVGEGYTFTVAKEDLDGFGAPIACGHSYGWRWAHELEVMP